jgi:hypothetical protein
VRVDPPCLRQPAIVILRVNLCYTVVAAVQRKWILKEKTMDIRVKGVYENGVVYLVAPLPANVDTSVRQEVEVVFEPLSAEEPVMAAEMEKIQAELATLGDPEDDTPEERVRRVNLFMKSLDLFPALSDEDAEAILELNRRPMSMFTLDEQYDSRSD